MKQVSPIHCNQTRPLAIEQAAVAMRGTTTPRQQRSDSRSLRVRIVVLAGMCTLAGGAWSGLPKEDLNAFADQMGFKHIARAFGCAATFYVYQGLHHAPTYDFMRQRSPREVSCRGG